MNKIFVLCAALLVCGGCNKKTGGTDPGNGFDQSSLLTNMADNLIVPAYADFSSNADNLATAIAAFTAGPGSGTLSAAQTSFEQAYKSFLHCEPYDFGPANGTVMLLNSVNYWPTKPALINAELSGNTSISNDYVNGLGAEKKGFPALGYLLFDITNGNDAVLDSFTSSATAARRKDYVAAVAQNIATNAKAVLQEWQSSYSASFKKNTGTQANSSMSLLLNSFVVNFETSKNKRLGIPIGRKDNFSTGPVDPTAVELPYTAFAKEMLSENATTLANIYQGKSSTGDGPGFDDYVASLNTDGAALNDSIKTEFGVFQTKIAAITSPMQTSLQADLTPAYNAWVETKKMLVLLKVDLASDLGILVTFSDNDGD